MSQPIKRISFFAAAIAVGAVAFGVVWSPKAAAVASQCSSAPATMCYKGSTYTNVLPFIQAQYLASGGTCGACNTSPN